MSEGHEGASGGGESPRASGEGPESEAGKGSSPRVRDLRVDALRSPGESRSRSPATPVVEDPDAPGVVTTPVREQLDKFDQPSPEEDWRMMVSAASGFLLGVVAAVVVLRLDTTLDKSYVMVAGFVGLTLLVIYHVFFGSGPEHPLIDDDDLIFEPWNLFFITLSFGLIIGGVLGPAFRLIRFGPLIAKAVAAKTQSAEL